MTKITFKKYGLSPEEVENMKKFNLKLDKRTMKQLISAYQTENINIEELESLEKLIGFSLPRVCTKPPVKTLISLCL